MSKGSSQRPTDKAAFDSGYERIFGPQAKSEAALQAIVDFSQEHGLYDLFEDVSAKLKYEPITRSEQHQQLERIGRMTLANQTCGNCNHWEHDAELEVGECHGRPSAFVGDRSIGFRPPADFSCSLWSAKP